MSSSSHTKKAENGVVHRHRVSPWPAVSMDEAMAAIESAMPQGTCKFIPTNLAKPGHVLVSQVFARSNVPEFITSTKDGYAVIASDPSTRRRVVGVTVAAPTTPDAPSLQPGECIRVCTGSILPPGADAVVMVENTDLVEHDDTEEKVIELRKTVQKGQDVRLPGKDIKEGDVLLEARTILGPAEIGLLASNGLREIEVFRRPRVCVMSTGNELLDSTMDEQLVPGQVRDSNRPQLMALFQSRGFKPVDAGIAHDNRESLLAGLHTAFKFASVVVTSGGVSMGERDLMKEVLEKDLGFKIHFGRVWMKPGLPATFATGVVNDIPCAVFALPGNPVSSFVCAELFAVPALRKMAGFLKAQHTIIKVTLANSLKLDSRPEYVRAILRESSAVGSSSSSHPSATVLLPSASATGHQCSSRLLSMAGANLLLRLPSRSESLTEIPAGTVVDALVVGAL